SKTDLSLVLRRAEQTPFGRNTDASDNELRLHRRHGQNERGMALGRKSWLFAGSDRGADRAAFMATLIMTAKLNDIDPQAWLADVLARIADTPVTTLEQLLPWNWTSPAAEAQAA
ncbi:transposase domain-containing protein, partial [Rhizobium laguerreae]|uniref:transposase domain-containing protein n=1 Tax=Rhizobium laguerreae TaxID=1076926 RepID=UPI0021B142CE